MTNYETVSVDLPVEVWKALDKAAKKRKITRDEFVTELVEESLSYVWSRTLGIEK
jgi:metal-responsive CopG/Arc/MetJ family transcriptional regulator